MLSSSTIGTSIGSIVVGIEVGICDKLSVVTIGDIIVGVKDGLADRNIAGSNVDPFDWGMGEADDELFPTVPNSESEGGVCSEVVILNSIEWLFILSLRTIFAAFTVQAGISCCIDASPPDGTNLRAIVAAKMNPIFMLTVITKVCLENTCS